VIVVVVVVVDVVVVTGVGVTPYGGLTVILALPST